MPSSTPSSPTSRRRRSSHLTNNPSSPRSARATPNASPTHSRHVSSQTSPVYRRSSSRSFSNHIGTALDYPASQQNTPIVEQHPSGGPGESLADELANAWEEDEDAEAEGEEQDTSPLSTSTQGLDRLRDADGTPLARRLDDFSSPQYGDMRPNGNNSPAAGGGGKTYTNGIHPPTTGSPQKPSRTPRPRGHTRKPSSRYDGSQYGDLSDSEVSSDLPSGLKAALLDVDTLVREQVPHPPHPTRPSTDTTEKDADPIQRLLQSLNTTLLHPQSTVETQATRLITTHTSLTTHLAYHTRSLQSSTYPLLSPLSPPPPPDVVSDILPLLAASLASIPQPQLTALNSMAHFAAAGRDVAAALGRLGDGLHMCRQVEGEAGRRLKSARDMVGEMRREMERGEEGRRWIEGGGWEDKLRGRECARECREVVGGFEEVCRGWRERLVRGADVVGAEGAVAVG